MPARNVKYEKPDEFGRKPENWPPIPKPPQYLVDIFENWLRTARGSIRGLPVAAPLLVVVCMLHEKGHWLPTRRRLAEALDTGTPSIDAALSTALGRDEITEIWEVEAGEVTARASIRRHRYLVPGSELLSLYKTARSRRSRADHDEGDNPGNGDGTPLIAAPASIPGAGFV